MLGIESAVGPATAQEFRAFVSQYESIPDLEAALKRARAADRTSVVVIDTDPAGSTEAGGWWWEVAVPAVSGRDEVKAARERYEQDRRKQSA